MQQTQLEKSEKSKQNVRLIFGKPVQVKCKIKTKRINENDRESLIGTLIIEQASVCSVPEFQKRTEFSDHGVSIPLRILTSSMLPSCLRRIVLGLFIYTIVYIIIFPLLCVRFVH